MGVFFIYAIMWYNSTGDIMKNICKELKKRLSPKRYTHTLGVCEMGIKLARLNNLNKTQIKKVVVATLLHDIAKNMDINLQKEYARNVNIPQQDIDNLPIIHGFASEYIAKTEFDIKDREILDAIRYHTIGAPNLGIIGRIVYISDAIEKNRDYPKVENIREKTLNNLNLGIIYEIEHKDGYLKSIGATSHTNTLKMKKNLLGGKI